MMLSQGRTVLTSDLPDSIRNPSLSSLRNISSSSIQTLENVEKEMILRVLSIEPNQEKAAELLGITKVTLWRKRKEYGLS